MFLQSYRLDIASLLSEGTIVKGTVKRQSDPSASLTLTMQAVASGGVRIRMFDPAEGERWQPDDILEKSALSAQATLETLASTDSRIPAAAKSLDVASYRAYLLPSRADDNVDISTVLIVHASPLFLELYRGDVVVLSVNERQLMHFERSQSEKIKEAAARALLEDKKDVDRHHGKEVIGFGEDGLATYADGTREERAADLAVPVDAAASVESWEERFGSHRDSRPRGPRSVGMDFSFPFAQHVYGIPQHTSPLSLPTTMMGSAGVAPHYKEPYRLYNLDVFEYELDETMTLYGQIPFMMAHGLVRDANGQTDTASSVCR